MIHSCCNRYAWLHSTSTYSHLWNDFKLAYYSNRSHNLGRQERFDLIESSISLWTLTLCEQRTSRHSSIYLNSKSVANDKTNPKHVKSDGVKIHLTSRLVRNWVKDDVNASTNFKTKLALLHISRIEFFFAKLAELTLSLDYITLCWRRTCSNL